MNDFKAIIWDMDGVLVESEKMHVQAEADTLKKYGIDLKNVDTASFMGMGLRDYFAAIGKATNTDLPMDELMPYHTKVLEDYYGEKFPEVPNVRETLEKLATNYVQALATSMEHNLAQIYLKRLGIKDFFKVVIGGNEVQHAKPNPHIFLMTAEKLGVKPEECLVVEDSENGVRAGKAANMTVIARRAHHNTSQDLTAADHLITDLLEIPVYLSQ